ncbi:hypothetical protein EON81_25845, partial [bacterium]
IYDKLFPEEVVAAPVTKLIVLDDVIHSMKKPEPEKKAEPEKAKVDAAYVRQAKRLLEAGHYPAIATQDERIIRELNAFVTERGIDRSTFEYQFLYGIRRELQQELTREGYNVRVYVPFGDSWYPYFTRRLAERPANAFFIAKSLFQK